MKTELIEKLKSASDYIKGRTQGINITLKFEELEFIIQAIDIEENYGDKMREKVEKARLRK